MKKILSVALSTAMAFSMFASVAFGADAQLSPEQKFNALKDAGIVSGFPDGLSHLEKTLTRAELAKIIVNSMSLEPVDATSYNDKNYAKHWGRTYIEAATQAGILNGKDAAKKLFDPNGAVTVQELAKVLVTALDLEVPADANNTASAWAKGFVAAAVKGGYLAEGLNYQGQASRSQAVVAAYAIYEQSQVPTVKSYKVVDSKNIEFTLSTDEVVKVTLEKALEANKETEVTFKTKDGVEIKTTVKWEVTTATKVEKVNADNLKEVVVSFDGTVDKESAEEVANYSLKSGKAIKSAALSTDEKTVTLTLEGTLSNNKKDSLSVSNVVAGETVVSAQNVEFTTVDNKLPEVESVKSLGTKSVKVVFTEPVNDLKQSNFVLDGKEYFGKVAPGANNRSVILSPFSSAALAVGDHKLEVKGVKDYANFVSLSSSHDFAVVEDKDAPTITEAKATLESVTVTFSEDVDADTVSASKVYWKSGSDKKTAVEKEILADNKYKFVFGTAKSLPTGSVAIYVEGVKDYSGNEIAKDTSVVVTPEIDQVRPEVKKVSAVDAKTIKVVMSKAMLDESVKDVKNYVVLNKDSKNVSVQSAKLDATDKANKTILVTLYTDLSAGDNTITVKNLKDATKLQNTMLDYSGTVTLGDKTAPELETPVVNTKDRRVVISFNEKMNPETLADYSNYLVTIDNKLQGLTPDVADISVLQDGTAVAITFAETLSGKKVNLAAGTPSATSSFVTSIHVLSVKDLAGNLLKQFSEAKGNNVIAVTSNTVIGLADFDKDHAGKKAKFVDTKTIKVKFSAGILDGAGAFSYVVGGEEQVAYVDTDGTSVVTVHFAKELKTDANGLALKVDLSKLETVANLPAGTATPVINTGNLIDAVAPVIKNNDVAYAVDQAAEKIAIQYSEALELSSSVDLNAGTFEVVRNADNKKLDPVSDYTVALKSGDASVIEITLKDNASRTASTAYSIKVAGAKYVTDLADNAIADSTGESQWVTGVAGPTVTAVPASFNTANGSITGVDTTMEYRAEGTTNYTSVTGTSITGLTPGTYYVRVKAVDTVGSTPAVPAGAETKVVITEAAPNNTEAVDAAKKALVAADLEIADKAAATTTITLPSTGAHGTTISWKVSANTGALVEPVNSVVSSVTTTARPATTSATATVTATITKGTDTVTKTFTITVPATGDITVTP